MLRGRDGKAAMDGCQLLVKGMIRWLLVSGVAISSVQSKEDEKDHDLETKLAIVALGPMPPRRYSADTKRGDAVMLLPLDGEVPPNKLYYQAGDITPEVSGKWRALPVAFNNTAVMTAIKAEVGLTLYRKHSKHYEPYAMIPALDAGARHVVFLTPALGGNYNRSLWMHRPRVAVVSPDSGSLWDKQFMIKNLSGQKVMHAFGESVRSIEPGDLLAYRRSQSGVLYRLAARYGKKRRILYNMAVRIDEGSGTHLYALYDAREETNAGRSVGVFRMVVPPPGS